MTLFLFRFYFAKKLYFYFVLFRKTEFLSFVNFNKLLTMFINFNSVCTVFLLEHQNHHHTTKAKMFLKRPIIKSLPRT